LPARILIQRVEELDDVCAGLGELIRRAITANNNVLRHSYLLQFWRWIRPRRRDRFGHSEFYLDPFVPPGKRLRSPMSGNPCAGPQPAGELQVELPTPAPDRLIRDVEAALGNQDRRLLHCTVMIILFVVSAPCVLPVSDYLARHLGDFGQSLAKLSLLSSSGRLC